jgi:hypothetical protein
VILDVGSDSRRTAQDDAHDALVETVAAADRTGRLRDILDAVRSNRVEDDFSSGEFGEFGAPVDMASFALGGVAGLPADADGPG